MKKMGKMGLIAQLFVDCGLEYLVWLRAYNERTSYFSTLHCPD